MPTGFLGPGRDRPTGIDLTGRDQGARRAAHREERLSSGISWVLAYTIAAEIGDTPASLPRASSPATAASARASTDPVSATCAARSANKDRATCAGHSSKPPRTPAPTPSTASGARKRKRGSANKRGAKVAQIDLARRLSEAIWHMLSRGERFAPKGATDPLAA